ncbi:hypothetical protein AQ505_24885 [Pedobacter sp. PACM 27299]|uniref:hypothetical protein n=1 Tax=Pedobacter sp. PACM 27299 TaxID=1727164 RepID=UPI0007063808|nr:hypothetical protein [Pedobacter sp. PACM 27299]ALL08423.1 hypothetical protein AQ505_24885 [Pedobacter sp. PACM 27299]
MEQELDMRQELEVLLAEPEKVRPDHAPMLKDLVSKYPYFQPLHLLLAKANLEAVEKNSFLATAALYTNGQLLHHFIYEPEYLVDTKFNVVLSPAFDLLSNQAETLDEVVLDEVPSESEETNPAMEELMPETDDFVLENIVSTDFFAFQDNFSPEPVPESVLREEARLAAIEKEIAKQEDPVIVSKYDDDQLPFTFLWWLHKTRKEYQQIFQPYTTPKASPEAKEAKSDEPGKSNELQQQYVEHIFHLQSPLTDEPAAEYIPGNLNHKGTDIIDSFLKNDPQISPPKAEHINTENKAKKSAEDHNDLVSETLAKIYIEQMLYDKAIETYEKLSLKFPEKSRYFADLIQSIEKKI